MRLAIFGYPRSGTTMLIDIVAKHFIKAGIMDPQRKLGEVFNVIENRRLVVENGALRIHLQDEPFDPVMSREERFHRFKRFSEISNQDYLIKVLSADLVHRPILPWLVEHYPIVTIERRNHLEAFLSWVIAWHSQTWNRLESQPKTTIEPFVADMDSVRAGGIIFARYFQAKAKIPVKAHIYYEDMVEMTPEEILRHIGVYQEGAKTPPTRWQKLTSFDEKVRLITNLDEVVSYYQEHVATIASIEW